MKMKKASLNTTKANDRKIKRLYLVAATVVAAAFVMAMPAFADDPLTTINNLSDFVFSAIKAIGAILLECSNLTTFAREISNLYHIPVLDVNLAIQMLYLGRNHTDYQTTNLGGIEHAVFRV